jgi:leucyl-tRNA synthetase
MKCPEHGYLFPEEAKEGKCAACGKDVVLGKTEKMSKSLKNIVDPDYLVEKYGADTARAFCLFASPPEKDLEWSDQGVEGSFRFLSRIWRIVTAEPFDGKTPLEGDLKNLRRKTHQTIRKVSGDLEDRFRFNTAISAVMELVNALYLLPRPEKSDKVALAVVREAVEAVLLLMAPIVPHITEELWEMLGRKKPLADMPWPDWDRDVASEEQITVVLQVNGKVRGRITVPADEEEEKIKALARADEKIVRMIEGKQVVKEIYVPRKLVNIVVKD